MKYKEWTKLVYCWMNIKIDTLYKQWPINTEYEDFELYWVELLDKKDRKKFEREWDEWRYIRASNGDIDHSNDVGWNVLEDKGK